MEVCPVKQRPLQWTPEKIPQKLFSGTIRFKTAAVEKWGEFMAAFSSAWPEGSGGTERLCEEQVGEGKTQKDRVGRDTHWTDLDTEILL